MTSVGDILSTLSTCIAHVLQLDCVLNLWTVKV